MNILVTGASGFLGTALLPRLSAHHHVTAITRAPAKLPHANDTLTFDLENAVAAQQQLTPWRWDAVVHLAGRAPKNELDWQHGVETITSHVRVLLHVIAAIPSGWSGRFVAASGTIVYGSPQTTPVREDHPRRPLHAYALAKLLAEELLFETRLADRWILRLGGLFAEHRRSGALYNFIRAAARGEPIRVATSSPPVPWQITHVDDAVESVIRALASTERDPGAINIGYGEPIHIVELAENVSRRGGRSSVVTLDGPSPPAFLADITKARALLAWPPVTLEARLDQLWTAFADDHHD